MLPVLAAHLHRFLVEGTCDATSDVPTARRSGKTDDGDHATRADEPPHPSYALGRVDVMQHRDGGDDIKRRRLEVVGEHIADDELDAISLVRGSERAR